MDKLPPETLRGLQIVAVGLMLGPVFFFVAVAVVRALGTQLADLPALMYAAIGVALASPLVAGALRHNLSAGFAGERVSLEKRRASVIVPLAVLEGAAMLCAVSFMMTPTYWPLLAAAVPLATMLLWFPRA